MLLVLLVSSWSASSAIWAWCRTDCARPAAEVDPIRWPLAARCSPSSTIASRCDQYQSLARILALNTIKHIKISQKTHKNYTINNNKWLKQSTNTILRPAGMTCIRITIFCCFVSRLKNLKSNIWPFSLLFDFKYKSSVILYILLVYQFFTF